MNKSSKNKPSKESIELAILNGIEAYRREQQQGPEKSNKSINKSTKNTARGTLKEPAGRDPRKSSAAAAGKGQRGQKTQKAQKSIAAVSAKSQRGTAGDAARGQRNTAKGQRDTAKGTRVPVKSEQAPRPRGGKHAKKPVKILFFGGVGEIGKNMTAVEYGNDIIVIDAGIIFPTEDMPGIDLVFPEITYLTTNRHKIRGVFLTHGHEDHIGGVPYLMKELEPSTPVYGTKLTLALVDNKLREHRMSANLITVSPKDRIKAGGFAVNIVNVNHSIAGATALAIETPYGIIFHSGDFKIDLTPVAGKPIDLEEIAEYGRCGVLLYLGESTNIERPGFTMSEKVVGTTLAHLFAEHANRRIIIATFASNVHRLQQIIDIAATYRRKVALSGRSMLSVVEAAAKIGEISIPEGILVDVEKLKNYYDREIVIVSTGSQGEPMSALTRMAAGEFNKVTIGANDTIIISASPIPGNERMIYRVINNLMKRGAEVVYESLEKIHVSGHACQEEHKLMHTLLRPKFFIPVHGEYRHLRRHVLLAQELGMQPYRTFIPDIGTCVEVTDEEMREGPSFPAGARLIDGSGFEDMGTSEVMKDRLRMSSEGVFIAALTLQGGRVVGDVTVECRGFVFADEREQSDAIRELKVVAVRAAENTAGGKEEIEGAVRRAIKNYLFKTTKQSPMIIPIIHEL